ncbi:MAG: hypothetical protein ACE3JQ_07625 [Paenisporosarcina sp.]
MNTQKGIVFEQAPSYCIFLTEDGRFQKGTPIPSSVLVGEEVAFRPYSAKTMTYSSVKKTWMVPVLAAVAIIFMFFSVLLPTQSKVLAFVQVDFNPSIELGIDKKGDVHEFKGLNEDGVALKREISFWKGKSLNVVLSTIVSSTELESQEKQIEITTIYKEKADQKSLEKLITTAVSNSTNNLTKEPVQIKEATIEERLEANEKGVSVEKYKKNINNEEQKEQKEEKQNKKSNKPVKKQEKNQPKLMDKHLEKEKESKTNSNPDNNQEKGQKRDKKSDSSRINEQKQPNNVRSQIQFSNNQKKHVEKSEPKPNIVPAKQEKEKELTNKGKMKEERGPISNESNHRKDKNKKNSEKSQ